MADLPTPDAVAAPVPLPIDAAAACIATYAWVERELYALLGRWATAVPEPAVKLMLGAHASKHGWHAELWADRLPVLRETDAGELVAQAGAALGDLFAVLDSPNGSLEKLVGVYRVLIPRKVAAYSAHLERTSPATDAPTIRSLRLALNDEIDDWRDGERLIQHLLLRSPEDVTRAAEHQARVEVAMLGHPFGPPPSTPAM